MSSPRNTVRSYWVAVRAMLILTLALGLAYPLLITGIGQSALADKADGSMINSQGRVVGSSLIGQSFTDADGKALPEWFQSRPSAAGSGYDAAASSGSNWGPENADLIAAITERRATIAALEGVSPDQVPADALTASASGLDPQISPAYAFLQVARVARTRGLPEETVRNLVTAQVHGRDLGILGEKTVNVLELNIALANLHP